MQKQEDKLGQTPDVKPIFKIDQAVLIDVTEGCEINAVAEDFDTLRANTPEDLIHWFIKEYHFSDYDAEIHYIHPGVFHIKNLWMNVAKQSVATKEEIESRNENVKPFEVHMIIVAEPRNLSQYNLGYWEKSYGKNCTEK